MDRTDSTNAIQATRPELFSRMSRREQESSRDQLETLATNAPWLVAIEAELHLQMEERSISQSDAGGIWANDNEETVHCAVCHDEFDVENSITLLCDHYYCRQCLNNHILAAVENLDIFPPRCCGFEITNIRNELEAWVRPGLLERLENMMLEYNTKDRIYCSDTKCSYFIAPQYVENSVARCPRCYRATCVKCRAVNHTAHCRRDEAMEKILALGAEQGWKSCYRCKNLIQKSNGCNHMSCHCGGQFCYVCGARWRTCNCVLGQPHFEEDEDAAHEVLQEQFGVQNDAVLPTEDSDEEYTDHVDVERDPVEFRVETVERSPAQGILEQEVNGWPVGQPVPGVAYSPLWLRSRDGRWVTTYAWRTSQDPHDNIS